MAAKILARDKSVVQAVKPILERCGQTGVGMKSGANAMVCAMRRRTGATAKGGGS
ncbi:hypothetical protein DIPPA_24722 [Diplonema papillatum]|nr:hypothetical protein DIPPA_24722 [Diplonema papillatum]